MYKIKIKDKLYESVFEYCTENDIEADDFNQPVTILDNVIDCEKLFFGYHKFNQPITIPNNVKNCKEMFGFCHNFNQPIVIPESVENCDSMFEYCDNFNQKIIIPKNVINCEFMLHACYSFNSPIILKNLIDKCKFIIGSNPFYDNIITTPMSNLYGFASAIKFKYKKNKIKIETRIFKDYNIDKIIKFNPNDNYIEINENDFATISLLKTLN